MMGVEMAPGVRLLAGCGVRDAVWVGLELKPGGQGSHRGNCPLPLKAPTFDSQWVQSGKKQIATCHVDLL